MRITVALCGFLAGAAAALALLLLNPLPRFGQHANFADRDAASIAYRADHSRGFEPTLRDFLGLPGRPARRGALADPALRHLRASLVQLPAAAGGEPGIAVRISVLARQNVLWRGQLGTQDYWALGWPRAGTLIGVGYSNHWFLLRDGLWAAIRREESGLAESYALSARWPGRPGPQLLGVSGAWRGAEAGLRESLEPDSADGDRWVIQLQPPVPPPPAP